MLDDQSGFAKPGGRREDGLGRSLDDHRSIGDTVHMCLLDGSCFVLPSQRGTFLSLLATGYISLRIPWALRPHQVTLPLHGYPQEVRAHRHGWSVVAPHGEPAQTLVPL